MSFYHSIGAVVVATVLATGVATGGFTPVPTSPPPSSSPDPSVTSKPGSEGSTKLPAGSGAPVDANVAHPQTVPSPGTIPAGDTYASPISTPQYDSFYWPQLDNRDATTQSGELRTMSPYSDYLAFNTVWVSWKAPASGFLEADTFSTNAESSVADWVGDTTLAVFKGATTLAKAKRLAFNDDVTGGGSANELSQVTGVPIAAGVTYYFQVGSSGYYLNSASTINSVNSGYIRLNVNVNYSAPRNDNFQSATAEAGTTWTALGSTLGSTTQFGEDTTNSVNAGQPVLNSIWYKWAPAASGTIGFDETPTNLDGLHTGDSYLAIYALDRAGRLTQEYFDQGSGFLNLGSFDVNSATTYYFQLGEVIDHAGGPVSLHIANVVYVGPAVSTVSPNHGSHHGGNTITVTGSRLGSAVEACFGINNCTSTITHVTASKIKVKVPAGVKGKVPFYLIDSFSDDTNITSHTYYTFS
jgi:hypothetical protein